MYREYLVVSDPPTQRRLEVREVTGLDEQGLTNALVEVYTRHKGRVDLEIIGQHAPLEPAAPVSNP